MERGFLYALKLLRLADVLLSRPAALPAINHRRSDDPAAKTRVPGVVIMIPAPGEFPQVARTFCPKGELHTGTRPDDGSEIMRYAAPRGGKADRVAR
jgi:hypothetical protein